MGLDCISTVVKIGVRMIQNATKWKEFCHWKQEVEETV